MGIQRACAVPPLKTAPLFLKQLGIYWGKAKEKVTTKISGLMLS